MLKVKLNNSDEIIEICDVELKKGNGNDFNIIGKTNNGEKNLMSIADEAWAKGIINNIKDSLNKELSNGEVFKLPDINSQHQDLW